MTHNVLQPQYLTDSIESYYNTLDNREYIPVRLSLHDIIDTFGIATAKEKLKEYKEELESFDRIEMVYAKWLFGQKKTELEVIQAVDLLNYDYERIWIRSQIDKLQKLLNCASRKSSDGSIGPTEIAEAKNVPIENYLSFNRQHYALCLWHPERNPSMYIYRKSNRVHCFSCGVDKDVIDVVQELHKVDFIKAIKIILNK